MRANFDLLADSGAQARLDGRLSSLVDRNCRCDVCHHDPEFSKGKLPKELGHFRCDWQSSALQEQATERSGFWLGTFQHMIQNTLLFGLTHLWAGNNCCCIVIDHKCGKLIKIMLPLIERALFFGDAEDCL